MLDKDHDTTTAATQLICIVLANYVNICKKPFTAEGWHIMQCDSKSGRDSGVIPLPGLFYVPLWDVFMYLEQKHKEAPAV